MWNIKNEEQYSRTFYFTLLLFAIATTVNFIFYVIPNLSVYPLEFHLTSFNSYFVIAMRIILPILSVNWSLEKRNIGWLLLIFLTTFNACHYLFWVLRLLLLEGSLFVILQQTLTLIFLISVVILYLTFKRRIFSSKMIDPNMKYALITGLIVALLFNVKVFFIG